MRVCGIRILWRNLFHRMDSHMVDNMDHTNLIYNRSKECANSHSCSQPNGCAWDVPCELQNCHGALRAVYDDVQR